MTVAAPHDRDLQAKETSSRDYSDRALQLRKDAFAALRAGQLIRSARLEQAARFLERASASERIDPECGER